VLLYPGNHAYDDIKNIGISEGSHPTEFMPQRVSIIQVSFLDTIKSYGRYSFAILIAFDGFIDIERPLPWDRTTYTFDYPIWFHSCEGEISSIPIGLYSNISQIMEGVRSEREFPRFTISYDKGMVFESITPDPDTQFNDLPYTFGICQEKRDGDATIIHTGLLPGTLISHNATLSQNETMYVSLYTLPFYPDEMVRSVIGASLDIGESYHTLGWFSPPSHLYLRIYREGWDIGIIFTIVFTIIGVPSIFGIYQMIKKRRKTRRKTNIKKRAKGAKSQ